MHCLQLTAQGKGSVENLVKWVKGSFFSQRRFVDRDDLLQQLSEWLQMVNCERPSRATGVVPARLLEIERLRLRPLRTQPDDFALPFQAVVRPTAEVSFEGATYTVHPDCVGLTADLYVYPERIRIVAGRHDDQHQRLKAGGRSVLPEHRRLQLSAITGKRGRRYLRRQHLLDLGGDALAYIDAIVHRRPGGWHRDVDAMHDMLQGRGADALLLALGQALQARLYGAEYVRWFLDHAPQGQQEPEA